MTVKQLVSMANDWEYICVEDDEYNVFVEEEAQSVRNSKEIRGLKVVCFYSGNRSGKSCIVVIAKKGE